MIDDDSDYAGTNIGKQSKFKAEFKAKLTKEKYIFLPMDVPSGVVAEP